MKIARIKHKDEIQYGIVIKDSKGRPGINHVIPKKSIENCIKVDLPETVEKMIEETGCDDLNLKSIYDKVEANLDNIEKIPINNNLCAPMTNPPKIICFGLNYVKHVKETGKDVGKTPPLWLKPRTAINGPYDDIYKPKWINKLDYEVELAVIIGKKGKNINQENAMNYVFGYMILNDISEREIQEADGQWTRAKSFDGFAPIGPYITTKDEINDPHKLVMTTHINNEIRQNSSTNDMMCKIPKLINHTSEFMTLEPGDIISTGTPEGVGAAMKPYPKFLNEGDIVQTAIAELGMMKNKIITD